MRNSNFIMTCLLTSITFFSCNEKRIAGQQMDAVVRKGLDRALVQYKGMAEMMDTIPGVLPKTILPDGTLETAVPTWWTSGFMPGVLWNLYEYSGDKAYLDMADRFTRRVECVKDYTGDHDIGFMLYCSYGNGNRLSPSGYYQETMLQGSKSLISRYDEHVGLIRSWDFGPWKYPVIIDNMMNLELLYWASKTSGDSIYREIADNHAKKTMQNHFRPDYSSYHVVSYNLDGTVEIKNTAQGLAHESAWARGQAWGLYGYTVCYRETKDEKYVEFAQHIADFLLNHPRLPEDKVPYWDFDAPDIPDALRDASAGAILASALIELSQYVAPQKAQEYLAVAEQQLKTLTSDEYLAEPGTNYHFILKHGVGHVPEQKELDVPLTYADYYYVEALMRYKKLKLD